MVPREDNGYKKVVACSGTVPHVGDFQIYEEKNREQSIAGLSVLFDTNKGYFIARTLQKELI